MSTLTATIARRWFEEVWNQQRDDTMDEMLSPKCEGFLEGQEGIIGMEMFKTARAHFLAAFPDLFFHIEDIVTEGDKAVVRWQATGTHCGASLGLAPTGRRVEVRGLTWLELENGRLVQGWSHWDHGGLLQKLRNAEPQDGG